MPKKEIINPQAGAILSPAARYSNLVFTAGMVGRDASGKLPPGIREQSRLTLEAIKATLEAAGTSMENVLKVTALLADIEDRPAFNEVYRTYFGVHPPARTCVQAGRLGAGVLVEVECIACIPEG